MGKLVTMTQRQRLLNALLKSTPELRRKALENMGFELKNYRWQKLGPRGEELASVDEYVVELGII